jgi:hypothetical protein
MSAASRARELARRIDTFKDRPRNPTGAERRAGAPRLTDEEWTRLREWQRDQCARLCGPWQLSL